VVFGEANDLDETGLRELTTYRIEASGGDSTFGDGNEVELTASLVRVEYDAGQKTGQLVFSGTLTADLYRVKITGAAGVRDAAGNRLAGGADFVSAGVGIVEKPAEVRVALRADSDTGASNSDGITRETAPTLEVSVTRRGQVEVDFDGDGTWDATLQATAPGVSTFKAPAFPKPGAYTVRARLTPWVGNAVVAAAPIVVDRSGPTAVLAGYSAGANWIEARVLFSEAIDGGTFTPADARLTGPGGADLGAPTSVTGSGREYVLRFDLVPAEGTYALRVGPDVTDVAENQMDQDGDGVGGESADDVFRALLLPVSKVYSGVYVLRAVPSGVAGKPFDKVLVLMSQPVPELSLGTGDVELKAADGTLLNAKGVVKLDDVSFEVDFSGLTGAGDYSLAVGTNSTSAFGRSLDQDHDGAAGEVGQDVFRARLVSKALRVGVDDLVYDGLNVVVHGASVVIQGDHVFDDLQVLGGAVLDVAGETLVVGDLQVGSGSELKLAGGATLYVARALVISGGSKLVCRSINASARVNDQWIGRGATVVAGNALIESGSKITADGQGYTGGVANGPAGNGPGTTARPDNISPGAGYGGAGGGDRRGRAGGGTYGSVLEPTDLGSGAAPDDQVAGGAGGGAIRLIVNGRLVLDGLISANGSSPSGNEAGGGSGGSIWVTVRELAGSGRFEAKGGDSSSTYWAGGGGGGRVAVYYENGSMFTGYASSTAVGGAGYQGGTVGSVVFVDTSVLNRLVRVFENVVWSQDSELHFGAVSLEDGAVWVMGGGSSLTVDGQLSVTQNSVFWCGGKNTGRMVDGRWVGVGLTITAGSVVVETGSRITADGQGYTGGYVNGPAGNGPGTTA
ncbi:MAG: Ig-like domain-containing protein, partial [Verrucomicrobiia bacterium]